MELADKHGRRLAALAGLLLPLCFAPFHLYFLAPLLLAVLFWSWTDQLPVEAAKRGFVFGFAAFTAGTYWVYISIHIFGGAPAWLAIVLMFGLVIGVSLYFAACGWLAASLPGRWPWLRYGFTWPAIVVLGEWLRGWLLTGFPWLSLGYGQIDGPLIAFAPVTGVYGLSLIVAMLAGAIVLLIFYQGRQRLAGLALAVLLALSTLALKDRQWITTEEQILEVSLIQGSISQDLKWTPQQLEPTMKLYRELTDELDGRDLIIWPEAAIPAIAYMVEDYLDELQSDARKGGYALLLGILTYDRDAKQYGNALMALGEEPGRYLKRHLVPFGEFFPVPDFIRSLLRLMSLPYSDIAHGPREQPALKAGSVLLAPSICYEDAFGVEQLDFLPEAGLLVNVSNDAWFGDSIAPHQHLQIARMRAVEAGRAMLRATNTGVTAIIRADGTIAGRLPQFETGVLSGTVTVHGGATPYVRTGNWPVLLISLIFAVLGRTKGGQPN